MTLGGCGYFDVQLVLQLDRYELLSAFTNASKAYPMNLEKLNGKILHPISRHTLNLHAIDIHIILMF